MKEFEKYIMGFLVGLVFMFIMNGLTSQTVDISTPTERESLNQVVETFGCTGYDQRGICKSAYGHLNYLNKNDIQ